MAQTWNIPIASDEAHSDAFDKHEDALEALRTVHSGASAPSATVAYMLWADTTTGFLKQRNAADDGWLVLAPLPDNDQNGRYRIAFADWVTAGATTLTFPTIPVPFKVLRKDVDVQAAFDSDGADLVACGISGGTVNAYGTDTDVSTTGAKSMGDGAQFNRYQAAGQAIQFAYTAGGSAATVGKALCTVELVLVPTIP